MSLSASSASRPPASKAGFLLFLFCLVVLLAVLFSPSFQAGMVIFSNDGPLGPLSAQNAELPGMFTGYWADLNWLGGANPSAAPNLTALILWLAGPVGYSKFFTPLAILLLGICGWFFFRRAGFHPFVCLAGGLAAAFNSDFFSYACWGLGALTLAVAATFLSLAILIRPGPNVWITTPLAGLALGMAIMEGYDNGAIFSLYIAAFIFFVSLKNPEPLSGRLRVATMRTALVAVFAAFIAAQTLLTLIGTQVKGMAPERTLSREQQWEWATDWSFPRLEVLRIIIPGLYGYRLDTPEGGNYWGSMGQERAWEEHFESGGRTPAPNGGRMRHSGAGPYAGIMTVLVGLWAVGQTFRKKDNPFTPLETSMVRFWSIAALISLLFAFGRHAPFYHIVYSLPFFSTIRIPSKFLHPFNIALVILFGYGLQGLWRRYVEGSGKASSDSIRGRIAAWWSSAPVFDRKWMAGTGVAVVLSALSWLIYSASRHQLEQHLQRVGFPASFAPMMAGFSIKEVGWFVLFFTLAAGLLLLIVSGVLSGPKKHWAGLAVGLFLIVDFGRANAPWVIYYNYQEKYASNTLVEMLREQPHLQRVSALFLPIPQIAEIQQGLQQVYYMDWMQHLFQYYNIQSLDIIQMPRVPADTAAFKNALKSAPVRLWELTNTRLLFGMAGMIDLLNQQFDPEKKRFRLHTAFTLSQERDGAPILVQTNTTGPYGLIEFTGALPRAKLYTQWQSVTNEDQALELLVNPLFDPSSSVVVSGGGPVSSTNRPPQSGSVEFMHYSPKRIRLSAEVSGPSVLLLNDKFDPHWQVTVDGKLQPLLRCNFIMRGVFLEPGKHEVEFYFNPPATGLFISLAAIVCGLLLISLLWFVRPGSA